MKIGFIAPALDLDRERRGERIFLLPPLTFPVLGALTPEEYDIEIIEERVQPIPFNRDYDLVGITYVTAFSNHAYEIADKFRAKGSTVVMGGPHASVRPKEALQHADSVVVGEAEDVWKILLNDFQNGRLQKLYRAPCLFNMERFPRPRLDLIPRQFTFKNSTLASKGCPFHCNFCFVNAFNKYRQRFRPIKDVVEDIQNMEGGALDKKLFIFWDDNFVGNPRYTKELLRAITPLGKKWATAASVNIANDDEMLKLLEKSGCTALFIGMESINSTSLKESDKFHNHVEKYKEMIKKLHDHGIGLTGAFVFGFDHDDPSVFNRTLEMAIKIDLDCMTPAILTPLPGTPLYRRMLMNGRIFDHNWEHYDYFHVVFKPRLMTPEELYEGFLEFNKNFFSYKSIFTRLGHSQTKLLLSVLANLGYHSFYKRMLNEYRQGLRKIEYDFNEANKAQKKALTLKGQKETETNAFYNAAPSLNKVKILVDAKEIFPFVYRALSSAERSIDLEMYLLEGKIGENVIRLLRNKAAEGIRVRLLYHPPSSLEAYRKIMSFLHSVGLKTRAVSYKTFYRDLKTNNSIRVADFPLHLFKPKFALKMAHNKLLIIDDACAVLGGMNFASITEKNHDVMIAVRGPVVSEMKKVFEQNWKLATGSSSSHAGSENPVKNFDLLNSGQTALVKFLVTMPYLENTREFLLSKIKNAKKRIWLEMYLFSDSRLIAEIINARKRRVEIKALLDANRLPLEFDLGGFPNKATVQKLLSAKIPVRIFRCEAGQEMHAKLVLFDDDEIVVGSTNWTYASFTANSESCVFIKSQPVFEKFREIFETDWELRSEPAEPLTTKEKIISAGFRLFNRVY
ncbi:MAG: radical SAM protein [Calditrichaeota bacterium]|nr:radical SAM protein [Calditrichota bacterium]